MPVRMYSDRHPSVVELPGIEPATEMVLTCGNTEFHDAKRRETT
jgi:hypothetical protein